jgi:hypothetical protein
MRDGSLVIVSLGAGVQSSCLYLMAAAGELGPVPDAAIFADTQSEPESVYRQLEYLRLQAGHVIPIYIVSQGNLGGEVLAAIGGGVKRCSNPPFHVINRSGSEEHSSPDRGGMLWRNCTKDYKLTPIHREVRRLLRECEAKHAFMWIGISMDEWARMKPSRQKYMTNEYPLVERKVYRDGCIRWLKEHGHPEPPKSACFFCPYTSNARWKEMRKRDPETFERAVEFDEALRRGRLPGVTGEAFVHRSMVPLSEVDLRTEEECGQISLFGEFTEECEGMCGV